MRVPVAAVLLAFLGGGFAAGVRAYEEGRWADAVTAFTAEEQALGHDAPAGLVFNRALAALRAGQLRIAELSAEKAAARGGPEFEPLRDFLLGNAAFVRARRAANEAALREADPTAFERAILHCQSARESWQRAALSRRDWPEARRNVERALRLLNELEEKRAEAEKKRAAKKAKAPKDRPDDDPRKEESEEEAKMQRDPGVLSGAELARLLAKLAANERDKRELRRAQQRKTRILVDKDW